MQQSHAQIDPVLGEFHPVVGGWFAERYREPTEPQRLGWPAIARGEHTLIAAPTGSGKTLSAFLACIDRLLKESLAGRLDDELKVVYVSPLRALSNDMHRNLEIPLAEITARAESLGMPILPLRVGLRTGDTSASKRAALIRRPPHILVTTPESLYLLLGGPRSREMLRTVEAVIVDEIHALVRDKRGSHLALTLERLEELAGRPLQRIGLSATQRPIERMAQFLVGSREQPVVAAAAEAHSNGRCNIIDVGHSRALDLAIETPPSELGAACTHEQWAEVYARIVELVQTHRSTLIFVNTRRMAERVAHQLTDLLGENAVGSHHGSLSAGIRLETERKLKSGELKAVVATASLELGLDVGYIDLVIQLGSPRAIATFLQRIGRSGHSLGLTPKGRLFALTRDELLESMALIRAVHAGRLDTVAIPEAPLDVLAQQIVAEVAAGECSTDALFDVFRRSHPYRNLARSDFDRTIEFLSEGIARSSGRNRVYLHHDQVGRKVRARPGARIVAASNAGAIPEIGSYRVVAQPEATVVGSVDEDFAVESQRGDVFLLGNTSWQIQNVRGGDVNVVDAHGAPPTIPFWFGEAPGRSWELSEEVSRLREDIEGFLAKNDRAGLATWFERETCCAFAAAAQIVNYCALQREAIGLLPTTKRVVFERFFDETGGMQLVVHAPFGAAVTRAWGLAMRKRFCRSYDFELQATADDDGFILSIGPQHSFPIESLFPMLHPRNAQGLLEQAILAIPMFQIRWRWNVTRALLVLRQKHGKKVPPALQRFRADDLLSAVFPRLSGCQEEHTGDIEMPDHPLVRQTMHDCLTEMLSIERLLDVLASSERGEIEFIARDTRAPSPFCYELLNANPYAFLDGGELQERRARAVSTRRALSGETLGDLGRLDPLAIDQVRRDAAPLVRNADELHDVLLSRIVLPVSSASGWEGFYAELAEAGRAATIVRPDGCRAWIPAERLPAVLAIFPEVRPEPAIVAPRGVRHDWESTDARLNVVRGLVEVCGPTTATAIARETGITAAQADVSLEALEGEGAVLRGRFTPPDETAVDNNATEIEWCHRALLARIHRLTLDGLRKQVEPVGVDVFLRFLSRQHGLLPETKRAGANGLFEVIAMLEGLDIPAVCWERDILPARLADYRPELLDELCLTGEVAWGRLYPPQRQPNRSRPLASLTRVVPVALVLRGDLPWLLRRGTGSAAEALSSAAEQVLEALTQRGAVFTADLLKLTQLLPAQLDEALGELIARGRITSDGFGGLRQLFAARNASSAPGLHRRRRGAVKRRSVTRTAGRWSLWRHEMSGNGEANDTGLSDASAPDDRLQDTEIIEQWAWQLLSRYGVVFRDVLEREPGAPRWFELLGVYRRLEARGEIRGGRFIAGVAGEQFALGDTVGKLRKIRDAGPAGELIVVSAADPLNLVGIITPGGRIAAFASNRVAYLDGAPVAALVAGEVQFFRDVPVGVTDEIAVRFGQRGRALARNMKSEPAADVANAAVANDLGLAENRR